MRERVCEVVHLIRAGPVKLHASEMKLEQPFLLYGFTDPAEVGKQSLVGVHAVDLAEQEVLVLVERLVLCRLNESSLCCNSLPVQLPQGERLSSLFNGSL